jgi:hypothetical protein
MYRLAALTLLLVLASSATAQVIYQPVQYQYTNGMTYYYGGNNPAMLRHIEHVKCHDGYPNSVTGHHYTTLYNTLRQTTEPTYVFTDCFHGNAAVYGYTSVDACNEAMANVPLYYTKRDLLNAAVPAADGVGLNVPAMGAPAGAMKMMGDAGATTQPSEIKPRAIIIIPHGAPRRPADQGDVKKAVAAVN